MRERKDTRKSLGCNEQGSGDYTATTTHYSALKGMKQDVKYRAGKHVSKDAMEEED